MKLTSKSGKKNVLILSLNDLDRELGFNKRVKRLIQVFEQNQFECYTVGFSKNSRTSKHIVEDKSTIPSIGRLFINTIKSFKENNYKLVVLNGMLTPFQCLILIYTKLLNIPAIYYMQDPVPENYQVIKYKEKESISSFLMLGFLNLTEMALCRLSNRVIVTSFSLKKHLNKKYKNLNRKISLIYNTHSLNNKCRTKKEDKAEISIIYVGGVQKNIRGLETQIEALSKLKSNKITMKIIGSGNLDYFKQLVEDKKLNGKIDFFGELPQNKLKEKISSGNMAILEPNPYIVPAKLFEYLEMNVIVILEKSCTEMIQIVGSDYPTYEKGNVDSLKKAIIDVYRNIDKYKSIAKKKASITIHYDAQSKLELAKLIGVQQNS